jgi:DNA invertase Pin-like site-specific DNA recombinase
MISEEKKLQILRLFQDDESIKEIVRQTGIARNTVRKVIRNVKPKKVGRPRALSDRTVRQIKHHIILHPSSVASE